MRGGCAPSRCTLPLCNSPLVYSFDRLRTGTYEEGKALARDWLEL
jgi:hypothetical protein